MQCINETTSSIHTNNVEGFFLNIFFKENPFKVNEAVN